MEEGLRNININLHFLPDIQEGISVKNILDTLSVINETTNKYKDLFENQNDEFDFRFEPYVKNVEKGSIILQITIAVLSSIASNIIQKLIGCIMTKLNKNLSKRKCIAEVHLKNDSYEIDVTIHKKND